MVIRFAGPAMIGRDQARMCARCMFGVGGWPMTGDSSQFRPLLRAVFSLCCLSSSGTNFNLQKPSPMTAFRVRCPHSIMTPVHTIIGLASIPHPGLQPFGRCAPVSNESRPRAALGHEIKSKRRKEWWTPLQKPSDARRT